MELYPFVIFIIKLQCNEEVMDIEHSHKLYFAKQIPKRLHHLKAEKTFKQIPLIDYIVFYSVFIILIVNAYL